MAEGTSRAVETGAIPDPSANGGVESLRESPRAWPWPTTRGWRHALLRRLLAFADAVAALLASISLVVVGAGDARVLVWSLAFLPAWIVVAKLLGLYDRDGRVLRHLTVDEVPQLLLWALTGTVLVSLFLALGPAGHVEASSAVVAGLVAAVAVFVLRAAARWLWRAVTPPEQVALVGTEETRRAVRRKLELFPDLHLTIVEERSAADGSWARGGPGSVERVVFAPAEFVEREILAILSDARAFRTNLTVVPPCRGVFGSAVELGRIGELPLLEYKTRDLPRSTLFGKRIADVVVSSVALVLLLPLVLAVALAIKLDSRGPVLFSQVRAGRGGQPFRMLKFRTMVPNAEALLGDVVVLDELQEPMFKLRDDPRVTRVGHGLRRWSLDELPQLWNVLAGSMSLVGPRPEQIELVDRYSPEHRFRLSIKPGITGPMQVYGRGELTFGERLELEADYIDNVSLARDLRILGMTLSTVVRGKGAY